MPRRVNEGVYRYRYVSCTTHHNTSTTTRRNGHSKHKTFTHSLQAQESEEDSQHSHLAHFHKKRGSIQDQLANNLAK